MHTKCISTGTASRTQRVQKYEKEVLSTITDCVASLGVMDGINMQFPIGIIQRIIQYTRTYLNLSIADNNTVSNGKIIQDSSVNGNINNFVIELERGLILFPAISELAESAVNVIQIGIQTLPDESVGARPYYTGCSLVLEHDKGTHSVPSMPNSIRYDPDGEIVNYGADLRPRMDRFVAMDIIHAEIVFDAKTIEYFKNGKSLLKSAIKFEYPWHVALWPHGQQKVIVIQDQQELTALREQYSTSGNKDK